MLLHLLAPVMAQSVRGLQFQSDFTTALHRQDSLYRRRTNQGLSVAKKENPALGERGFLVGKRAMGTSRFIGRSSKVSKGSKETADVCYREQT